MDLLNKFMSTASGFIWGPPMLILLVGTGLYLSIKLKGMQFWALGHAIKLVFSKRKMGKVILHTFKHL